MNDMTIIAILGLSGIIAGFLSIFYWRKMGIAEARGDHPDPSDFTGFCKLSFYSSIVIPLVILAIIFKLIGYL